MQILAASLLIAVAVVTAEAGVVSVVPATTLVRTPSLDSSVVQSERLGGSFAYSTAEQHAYAEISPVVQNVVAPVAYTYAAQHIAAVPAYAHAAISAPTAYEPTVVVAK